MSLGKGATFEVKELPPETFKADWRDIYRIPFDFLKALFWLTPKAIIQEFLGKESHHHEHDEPIDNTPGWQSASGLFPGLERQYFEAEAIFKHSSWHAIDGYQFRFKAPFPDLEKLYF